MPQDRQFRAPRLEPLEYESLTFRSMPWHQRVHEFVGLDLKVVQRTGEPAPDLVIPAGAREVPWPELPGVRMMACDEKKRVFVQDRSAGGCMGVSGGVSMPYVLPEFRGRGYGSAALFLKERLYGRMSAISYSAEGLMNRAAVHKHHINEALAAGRHVPDRVLQDYEVRDGKAKLLTPYTTDRHNGLRARYLDTQARERYEAIATLMSFETAFNPRELIMRERVYAEDSQPFALAAHRARPGSKLLRIPVIPGYADYAVHDKETGSVIDVYGVRPEAAFRAELALRRRRGEEAVKATVLRSAGIEKLTREAERWPLRDGAAEALDEVLGFLRGATPRYAASVEDPSPD